MYILSLRTHMIVVISLVTLILTVSLVMVSTRIFRDNATRHYKNYGELLASDIASASADYIFSEMYPSLQEVINEYQQRPSVKEITIADRNGFVCADSTKERIGKELSFQKSELWNELGKKGMTFSDSEEEFVFIVPIEVHKLFLGQVRVAVSLEDLTLQLSAIRRNSFMMGLGIWAVSITIGILIARRITGPMNKMTMIADSISTGDFSLKSKAEGVAELVRFSEALNTMAKAIKSRENELRKSEEKYRSIFEGVKEGVFVASSDGRIIHVNPAMQEIFGYELETEMQNLSLDKDLLIESVSLSDIFKIISKQGFIKNHVVRMIKKDGEEIIASLTCNLRMEKGMHDIRLEGIIRDITQEILAQEEIEKWRNYLDDIINSMPSVLVGLNMEGQVTLWNRMAQQHTGMTFEEAQNRSLGDLFPIFKGKMDRIKTAIQKGEFWQKRRAAFSTPEGERFFNIIIYPLKVQGQKGAVILLDDVTGQVEIEKEKSKLEFQLQQTQKMEAIGTLAGGVAHDFNNILSAIIGYTELSIMNVPGENPAADYLDEILKAGSRAGDLVQQILTFSRQTEQELKPVSVSLIVKEALKLLRASLPSTIDIRQNIKSDSLVMGDPTQIHQIVMNLCTNAGQAMKETGGILGVDITTVELDSVYTSQYPGLKPGPYLYLTVSDTGRGMSAEILERIFDPFFTTKEKGEGTGMGLAVVHGIVESCGGAIHAYSELGQGSVFKIFLPVIESSPEPDRVVDKVLPKGAERILFVDDEPALIEIGQKMLESLGYEVVTKTSSLEALDMFREQPEGFDLVITDLTMPQMTGDKLAKEILAIREDAPIIICTGFSQGMTEEKAKAMGIKGFLMKPIIISQMAGIVRQVLDETKGVNS